MRLLTGFPGFLGTEFVARLLRLTDARFLLLTQKKFEALARNQIIALEALHPGAHSRLELIFGDITLDGLGLADDPRLKKVTEIDHFAAVYDLNVSIETGTLVNQTGTRNVLNLIKTLPSFNCLHYVSTCYVSGRTEGRFLESDLDQGQSFNNFYESTKFEAEKLVRKEMAAGMKAVIYRPSIVVGNSRSGETKKFDGPYFVLQWILRQGHYAVLPEIGDPTRFRINLVPSDFVLDSMAFLAVQPSSIGKTFHLADPSPLTIQEVLGLFEKHCNKKLVRIPVPLGLAKAALAHVPGVESWLGIPLSSLDYFVHPTAYDVRNTLKGLEGSGISCPPFASYVQAMIDYRIKNPDLRTRPLI